MDAFNIPLSNIAQISTAGYLKHAGSAGNFGCNPRPFGASPLHFPQRLPDAGIRILERGLPPRLQIQGQHDVEQGGQLEHGIIEADSNAGAQGVSHQHPTALRHFHVGDPNHQLVIHPKHPASAAGN